jgi:hypothetical protein
MKGNEKAYKAIEMANNFFISVVTYMELVKGEYRMSPLSQ